MLVDVILPNFNKGEYLEEAIDSVLSQTYKNWKLYIIDDHSSDNSYKVLQKFENQENIFVKKLYKNMGPSFCRNLGLRISNSQFIAFLDSDDFWTKNKLELQINFMKKNKYEFTFTDYTPFLQKKNEKNFIKSTNISPSLDFKKFTQNSSINTSTMMITRTIVDNLKFKKIQKLEDYLFKCQILKKGIVAKKLKMNLASYRILQNSRSSQKLKNIWYLWKINKKYLEFSFIKNFFSIFLISINSIKKYGIK